MALFDAKSRYVLHAETVRVVDRRGRAVVALTAADEPALTELGEHRRREGQRLDHLAAFYCGDPSGFWRIAEMNGAMLPDALAEAPVLKIPARAR